MYFLERKEKERRKGRMDEGREEGKEGGRKEGRERREIWQLFQSMSTDRQR